MHSCEQYFRREKCNSDSTFFTKVVLPVALETRLFGGNSFRSNFAPQYVQNLSGVGFIGIGMFQVQIIVRKLLQSRTLARREATDGGTLERSRIALPRLAPTDSQVRFITCANFAALVLHESHARAHVACRACISAIESGEHVFTVAAPIATDARLESHRLWQCARFQRVCLPIVAPALAIGTGRCVFGDCPLLDGDEIGCVLVVAGAHCACDRFLAVFA